MNKEVIVVSGKENIIFYDSKKIYFFCSDLINFKDLFKKIYKKMYDYHLLDMVKNLEKDYFAKGFFNNLNRTKSFMTIHQGVYTIGSRNIIHHFNVFPKNIKIVNSVYITDNEKLFSTLNNIIYQIYNIFSHIQNNKYEKKTLSLKSGVANLLLEDKLLYEYESLNKIKKQLHNLSVDSLRSISLVKNHIVNGLPDLYLNSISNKEDGIIQYIEKDIDISYNLYYTLLRRKLNEYIKLNTIQSNINIALINKILFKLKFSKEVNLDTQIILNKIKTNNYENVYKNFQNLFYEKLFFNDINGFESILYKKFDVSILWEFYVEYYLSKMKNEKIILLNGNKKNKILPNNNFFENEYELKYDLILQEDKGSYLINNVIDAKFKIAKKKVNGEIIYDANDMRQLYVYLDAYNETESAFGSLVYPKSQIINLIDYEDAEIKIEIQSPPLKTKNSFLLFSNSIKKISKDNQLKNFKLSFEEIPFFNIKRKN